MDKRFELGSSSSSRQPLSQASTWTHPDDVLNDPRLSCAGKREVLASWVSDTRSVEGAPSLRQLESGAIVSLDAIMDALKSLKSDETSAADYKPAPKLQVGQPVRRRALPRWLRQSSRFARFDDDDEPPPCPASSARPLRLGDMLEGIGAAA